MINEYLLYTHDTCTEGGGGGRGCRAPTSKPFVYVRTYVKVEKTVVKELEMSWGAVNPPELAFEMKRSHETWLVGCNDNKNISQMRAEQSKNDLAKSIG